MVRVRVPYDRHYDIGYYINADEIEQELKKIGFVDLTRVCFKNCQPYSISRLHSQSSLYDKAIRTGFNLVLEGQNDKIVCKSADHLSYEAALIADFLRRELIIRGSKLTFESVMSHPSKVRVLEDANQNGYKTYLYFICTSSPEINIERVNLRVKKGGHAVDKQRIRNRYFHSLSLLKDAVSETYRSFIWDN